MYEHTCNQDDTSVSVKIPECAGCCKPMHMETPRVGLCMPCRILTPIDDTDETLREAQAIAEALANPPEGEGRRMS